MNSTKKVKGKKTHQIVKKPEITREDVKVRKRPHYKSFRFHRAVKHPSGTIPSSRLIASKALRLMLANKVALLKFLIIFGLLYVVFVRGFASPVDIDEIRDAFDGVIAREITSLATNITVAMLLVQSTVRAGGEVQGVYQSLFVMVGFLSLIWVYRQQQAGNKPTFKESLYRGMYPLIPFLLVFIVVALEAIPATAGNYLLRTVLDNDIAIGFTEQLVWVLLTLLLVLLSAYLMTSSIIALMIVTLPEMTPMKALRKAKGLVEFRRHIIMLRLVFIALVSLIFFVGIIFPLIFVSVILAQIVYFILTVLFLPFMAAYLYVLYRELL
ncbi:MAG TPA: hypothetical protein PKD20_02150 [Candidatus Saccharibacteria bacterium]|nr:hypothetical protein [Candidatus Saccharibacteria bacterium]HMT55658.1 hypothetical protein [Candidatus Saccharibacteria bacterium]